MIIILGAGLAGLSCSYHIGHEKCIIFEREAYAGGHISSHHNNGFVWDEGPHVSFTKHAYVRELFEQSVQGEFLDYPVKVSNYFQGSWIPHPAQANLYAVPEPYRSNSLNDFLKSRKKLEEDNPPANYAEWLERAFGEAFASTFPSAYTRKYWTCDPHQLTTDWVGQRVFFPDVDTVMKGYHEPPTISPHYINTVRYPKSGGYISFAEKLREGANVHFGHTVECIDLIERLITFVGGKQCRYEKLINTLPLPELIRLAINVPEDIKRAALTLSYSSLLLVNVTANHVAHKPYHWLYVYDEDKLSTRINHTELLSPNNAPTGKTGVQVEVYASPYKVFPASHDTIAKTVVSELIEMGLIDQAESVHTRYTPFANVIFNHTRREAQNAIFNWLERFGLQREADDLEPMTDWSDAKPQQVAPLNLAGRFGQWKYFWTDDCVLRGLYYSESRGLNRSAKSIA
jgi:protoporphyrinogen oxidase